MKDTLGVRWGVQKARERKVQELCILVSQLTILSLTNNTFKCTLFAQLLNTCESILLFTLYFDYYKYYH